MKKQIFSSLLFSSLLILSCVTTASVGLVYDESVPLEKSAWLGIGNLGTVTGYNGITVSWKPMGTKMIQIPAGETLLEVDVHTEYAATIYKGKGLIFQYNFQPESLYYIFAGRDTETGDAGVHIYAYDFGEKLKMSQSDFQEHLEAFTPFLNAEGNTGVGGQTVLE
jgi:hypothetical protein